jgi:hypothetical protein
MTELRFRISDARAERYAAVPTLAFRVGLNAPAGEIVHSILLRCQIRIEPQRRRYSATEEERLRDLFGETPRWGDTVKPFLWSHVATIVSGFTSQTEFDLALGCSYDLEVAAAKYLHALEEGEVPLVFLFSGTIFAGGLAGLSVSQISWNSEATYRLPARLWRELMNAYFPNAGWLRLQRETIDRLMRFKSRRALLSWDQTLEVLLREAGEGAA